MRVEGRNVPIKLVVLACDAECRSANVIEVSELGDIGLLWRRAEAASIVGDRGSTSAFALKPPRREEMMKLATDLLRTKPREDPLPLPRLLLLACRSDDGWIEQTLDRAQLSAAAQSFVRELAGGRYLDFGPWVPQLPCDAKFQPDHRPEATTFAATDDGKLLASVQDQQVILLNSELQPLRSVDLPEPMANPAPIELIGLRRVQSQRPVVRGGDTQADRRAGCP